MYVPFETFSLQTVTYNVVAFSDTTHCTAVYKRLLVINTRPATDFHFYYFLNFDNRCTHKGKKKNVRYANNHSCFHSF